MFSFGRIEYLHTTFQCAGKDPGKRLLPDERIMDQFECKSRKWLFGCGMTSVGFFRIINISTDNSANIDRGGKIIYNVPWPADAKNAETGGFVADVSRVREELGWAARTGFDEGIASTIDFYKRHLPKYV